MSSPEELLAPLRVVLGDLITFAHERYCDAIKSSTTMTDQLRLVAAAEAFQTLAAVQQITQAVGALEQSLRVEELRNSLGLPSSPLKEIE